MAKRIHANVFVKQEDGSFIIEAQDITRFQLEDMVSNPENLPEEFKEGAGNWRVINWWYTPGTNDYGEILCQSLVPVEGARTEMWKAIFECNPEALKALSVRKYRGYKNRKETQQEVWDVLNQMTIEADEGLRVEMATNVAVLLNELGFVPIKENKDPVAKTKKTASKKKATKKVSKKVEKEDPVEAEEVEVPATE